MHSEEYLHLSALKPAALAAVISSLFHEDMGMPVASKPHVLLEYAGPEKRALALLDILAAPVSSF